MFRRSYRTLRADVEAMECPPPPPGWEIVLSRSRKVYYYRNKASNATQWSLPPLPPDWQVRFDERERSYYFVHAPTGRISLEFPNE